MAWSSRTASPSPLISLRWRLLFRADGLHAHLFWNDIERPGAFSMRELVARIRVLFRRLDLPADEPARRFRAGPLELDADRHTAELGGRPLRLTVTEFLILESLVRRPGIVKTRRQLMEEGYPFDTLVSERTIDTHIKRLRQKLRDADPGHDLIETVFGLGYRFREPVP